MNYTDTLEKLKSTIECKYNMFGTPTAFNIHNEEEYKLVLDYKNLGSRRCNDCKDHYKYDYKGEDWYFFEYQRNNEGMDGIFESYWQETLSEKKEKFEDFCKQFE